MEYTQIVFARAILSNQKRLDIISTSVKNNLIESTKHGILVEFTNAQEIEGNIKLSFPSMKVSVSSTDRIAFDYTRTPRTLMNFHTEDGEHVLQVVISSNGKVAVRNDKGGAEEFDYDDEDLSAYLLQSILESLYNQHLITV